MKILSLFDGISCARVALERAGINVESYYASEIDKYAIQISQKNYPDIKHVGSVTELLFSNAEYEQYKDIDLLIGGSPCQDLSIAKAGRKGLDGERSGLFYEYVRIRDEVKPKYFILENVASMSKESKDKISEVLGVEPIMINASLVSAQNRKRLFWVGKLVGDKYVKVDIDLPQDRNILLKDILEYADTDRLKSYCIDANYWKGTNWEQYKKKGRRQLVCNYIQYDKNNKGNKSQDQRIYYADGKMATLPSSGTESKIKIFPLPTSHTVRKLTPTECERLQGLPDNYTEGVSNTQRYKCLGNAFNVDVVSWILSFIPKV